MRTLRLPTGQDAFSRGAFHGRAFKEEIARIAEIRSRLAVSTGLFRNDGELLEVARMHLPVLEAFDADLYAELSGIADGSGQTPERIVVLNHYTDLKDLDPATVLGGAARGQGNRDDECSAVVAGTSHGAVLGQTWDMHGSAAPFVLAMHVPEQVGAPECWVLTITGCLGMCGMNAAGVGITINNLKSRDARVGLVWPALVRAVLSERDAKAGRDVVLGAPLGSGHHYLVADAWRAYGIETSGHLFEVWAEADLGVEGAGFHHENHCLGTQVATVSDIASTSTTLARHRWLERSLSEQPIRDPIDLFSRFGSHEDYPRSLCTHLANPEQPDAMATCAGVVMSLTERRIWMASGCLNGATPVELPFGPEVRRS